MAKQTKGWDGKLSPTALKVIRYISRHPGGMPTFGQGMSVQIAGHKRAPWLSACRSMVAKGLMFEGSRTGHYGLTKAGIDAYLTIPSPTKDQP